MNDSIEHLILVDEQDQQQGVADKLTVHQQGLCHRAFSVFVWRHHDNTEILLQQRQWNKYHCGGLWTNTCCGHPRPGESIQDAAQRRLQEEMGLQMQLDWCGKFHYVAPFTNGLVENEVDHVFIAQYQGETIQPNDNEVSDHCWTSITRLKGELIDSGQHYTPWLNQALDVILQKIG